MLTTRAYSGAPEPRLRLSRENAARSAHHQPTSRPTEMARYWRSSTVPSIPSNRTR
ncbi:Uncharacterised protein [Mycobacteroides abscessus]|nr:Uncharacterised protein [Mycobacteroides abscessus]